ncbi:hypothetical protein O3G_MSEX003507 [Manduca sexta]|uniref:Enoyl-CoA delta isomerase 1, mitochondrial n=1 Tax=Manduca sexta TaxID=7130 RepID=A0A921YT70_MANSE|nr:hypothetical protein O3G_MSEX003507 [Manduca sexta]
MIPLRQAVNIGRWAVPSIRCMSAKAGPLVDVAVDNEGYAMVTLQRPPVNSLNLELLQDISKSLDEVGKNKSKGMILTSSSPTVFSAGLDIMEMYKPDLKRAESFWRTLQDVWLKLFGSTYPTAAAINGHAPAGGCLLATSCEYRVMVSGKYTIGLNETALGIVAPRWFMDTMSNTVSRREAELALTTARMFSVDEALKEGLVDETATDKADAVEKCKKFLKRFERIPALARGITKQRYREPALNWLSANREQDLNEFMAFLQNPKVQQSLEMYIQNLKKKAAK